MDDHAAAATYQSIAFLLRAHGARHPDKPAVVDVDRGESIAFGELAVVVDGVALQLQRLGVSAGMRVVLRTAAGIETVIMWLALWRLAAVVCPIDATQLSSASEQAVFASLQPTLALRALHDNPPDRSPSTGAPEARFGGWPATTDEAEAGIIRLVASPPGSVLHTPGAQPGDVAAMCCTSGSAGRTKIVVHDHASYWLNGLDSIELLGLHRNDRTLEYRSFGWYSSQILSLMPFLQIGVSLHVARQFSRSRFGDWIERHGITVAAGVPTVLNLLLNGPMEAFAPQMRSLRLMTSSSAPLSRATWQRFEKASGVPLVNLYGSSEAGWICGNRLGNRRIGSVGQPASHAVCNVLDGDGQPCGSGMPGEVVVHGPKLAMGLLRADGTIEPLRGRPYFTRDLAMRDSDGFIQLLGRMDDLVIRGGVKVSPQEIEEALLAHPDVVEAGAVGVPDAIYGQEAICFVVLRAGAQGDPAKLQAHVAASLPREKRPKAVHVVDGLPRNARGKLDRDSLRQRWRAFAATPP
jgi:acyl-coenzyme A synthetase/AMP-(fatty) acid ligase